IATMRTEELLQQSQSLTQELQSQSEELQAQRDELERTNEELEEQARSLKASEELLQSQQEELQQTNAELEEKAQLIAEQNARDARDRRASAPAGAEEPALERVQVHRQRHSRARDRRRRRRCLLHRPRHWRWDPGRQAEADLRGLPAGGRDDEPSLRRHGARSLDLA